MTNPQTFTLGLTMAGAVSAGAYTAGVIDVLFRALDAHNAATGTPGGPKHKVAVKVMSGASAGGVSTSLAVAALIGNNRRGRLSGARAHPNGYDYTLDVVHDVWVDSLDLMHEAGPHEGTGFLSLGDLEDPPVRSALNSGHIDAAADRALQGVVWPADAERYDFLAEQLELFVTTTNLMGVPYAVRFAGVETGAAHVMAQHSVARHFRVGGLGSAGIASPWLDAWRDDGIELPMPPPGQPVDFTDTPGRTPEPWVALRQSSIATGAFPFGLSPRLLRAEVRDYGITPTPSDRARGGAWPIEEHPDRLDLPRAFHDRFTEQQWQELVPYVAVDGGVANNEPFEIARFTIRETLDARRRRQRDGGLESAAAAGFDGSGHQRWLASNDRRPDHADRAVIMIDPFPEGPEFRVPDIEGGDGKALGLLANLALLPGALKDQARFKPGELLLARDDSVASRFMIAPAREEAGGKRYGAGAIASGLLGGFGGFIDRAFREHDFRLGQHNCASFLARHFVLDPDNPTLGLDDAEKAGWRDRMTGDAPVKGVPVIRGLDAEAFPQPRWPVVGLARLSRLLARTQERMAGVGAGLIAQTAPHWGWTLGGRLTWWLGRGLVAKKLAGTVLSELIARNQVEDFEHLRDGERRILAALAGLGPAGATAEEIAAALAKQATEGERRPDATQVAAVLDRHATERDGHPPLVWRSAGKAPRYTLFLIRPSGFRRARLLGRSMLGR